MSIISTTTIKTLHRTQIMEYTSPNESQTKSIGRQLATMISPGSIITLSGDLGAGKTTFTKGFAEGLGVKETITSPTFSLMNVYPVHEHPEIDTFVHIDTYRLKHEEELIGIGVEDYLAADKTVVIIEWPEKISGMLKKYEHVIEVEMKNGESAEERVIEVHGIS